jgi:hypothetical protein
MVGEDLCQVTIRELLPAPIEVKRPQSRAAPMWIGSLLFYCFGEQEVVVSVRREAQEFGKPMVQGVFPNLHGMVVRTKIALSELCRDVSFRDEILCQCSLIPRQFLTPIPVSPPLLVTACVPAGSGWTANRSGDIGLRKEDTFRCQSIHIRCFDIVGRVTEVAEISVTLIIGHNDEKVGAEVFILFRLAGRK